MNERYLLKEVNKFFKTWAKPPKLFDQINKVLSGDMTHMNHAIMIFPHDKPPKSYYAYLEFEGSGPINNPTLFTAEGAARTFRQQKKVISTNAFVREAFLDWSNNQPIWAVFVQVGYSEPQSPVPLISPKQIRKWGVK